MHVQNKKKLLIVSKGLVYSLKDNIHFKKFKLLSTEYCGDILNMVHKKELVNAKIYGFNNMGCYIPKWARGRNLLQNLFFLLFLINRVVSSHRKQKYDVIIAREPIASGVIGLLLSKLFRVPLIVEFNGNYVSDLLWESETLIGRIKKKYVRAVIPLVSNRAGGLKVLYDSQLSPYNISGHVRIWRFHDFVPVDQFSISKEDKGYVLFMGSPWYLKGVDVLVKAFKKVEEHNPSLKLKIITWFSSNEDKNVLMRLVGDSKNIEVLPPVLYEDAMKYIMECSVFILPSRTEAMGRVLLESMAFGKPVIASKVDGIPTYIDDGETGLLFDKEDSASLSRQILHLLEDHGLREKLVNNANTKVKTEFSERSYFDQYRTMIETVTK